MAPFLIADIFEGGWSNEDQSTGIYVRVSEFESNIRKLDVFQQFNRGLPIDMVGGTLKVMDSLRDPQTGGW